MRKILLSSALIISIIILVLFLTDVYTTKVCFKDACITVEVVDTKESMQKGLMFREFLDENTGMLFIFKEQKIYPFWMKNTLMPLDIIWINDELSVVHIEHATPCTEDPCTLYKPALPAQLVLETNKGVTEKHNINVGDKVVIQ